VDDAVVDWLAEATGSPATQVADELALGERRRAFVVAELREAGLTGAELFDAAVRLTGLDEDRLKQLLR
jgi:hypothetical protein